MADLSHSTDRDRFIGKKPDWLSLPAVWPAERGKPEQGKTERGVFLEDQPLPPSRRLIIILPDASTDFSALPKRIWNLAAPECRRVLLMVRPYREEDEFHAHVDLITLAAMIRDTRVVVETQLVLGKTLDQAVRQRAQPDDVIVCFEDHQVRGFLKKRQLAKILAQKTHRPVYTLKGTVAERVDPTSARMVDFIVLALCLVSLIAFFALEIWIDQNSTGTLQTVSQILAVVAETWVIGTLASKSFPT